MTDPVSLTFGVIGTLAVALHAVRRAKDLAENIEGAPRSINDIAVDLRTLANVLENLESELRAAPYHDAGVKVRIVRLLEEPLKNCGEVADVITTKLGPFIRRGPDGRQKKWRGLMWFYREKEFSDLAALLASYKSSLEIALGAANL
jgi:Fungal N-terminal domain of STAND proteins